MGAARGRSGVVGRGVAEGVSGERKGGAWRGGLGRGGKVEVWGGGFFTVAGVRVLGVGARSML